MVPALLVPRCPRVLAHTSVGCSTGYMGAERGDWPELVRRAAATSTVAAELTALSEPELPGLVEYLEAAPSLPFGFVAAHAPTKLMTLPEAKLVALLERLAPYVDAVVVHPDAIGDPALYAGLGRALAIENMDPRKPGGRTVAELEPLFEALPDARLCFDVAHAKAVDPTLAAGAEILARLGGRLGHVHVSSLDAGCHHVPLTEADEALFAPLLGRCRDVPWILEAPPRDC